LRLQSPGSGGWKDFLALGESGGQADRRDDGHGCQEQRQCALGGRVATEPDEQTLRTSSKPGSVLTLCTIHLLPKGDRPAMVSFQGEVKAVKPLLWRAG
jgi:hypothetical protein